MVLENEKARSEKLYCVGYLKTLGKYILCRQYLHLLGTTDIMKSRKSNMIHLVVSH